MITIAKLKVQQKILAKQIRELKNTRKACKNGYVPGLMQAKFEYRYQHIAYCIARGKTYEQIEPKTHDDIPTRNHVAVMYKRILSNIEIPIREVFNEKENVCCG